MHDATSRMTDDARSSRSTFGRLSELDDYQVAEGHPDIRGWPVKGNNGATVGKVTDLIVDTNAMRVRYVDVEIDRSVTRLAEDAVTPGDQGEHTLLPIGSVQLDESHDDVLIDGYTLQHISALPRYDGVNLHDAYESDWRSKNSALWSTSGAGTDTSTSIESPYDDPAYDDQRTYATRRPRDGEVTREDIIARRSPT